MSGYWERIVDRGIANERSRAGAAAFEAAFDGLQGVGNSRDARYFFNLSNGNMLKDVVGESFDLPVHARDHAVQAARELAGGLTSGRSISVTDEKGDLVFRNGYSRMNTSPELVRKLAVDEDLLLIGSVLAGSAAFLDVFLTAYAGKVASG